MADPHEVLEAELSRFAIFQQVIFAKSVQLLNHGLSHDRGKTHSGPATWIFEERDDLNHVVRPRGYAVKGASHESRQDKTGHFFEFSGPSGLLCSVLLGDI